VATVEFSAIETDAIWTGAIGIGREVMGANEKPFVTLQRSGQSHSVVANLDRMLDLILLNLVHTAAIGFQTTKVRRWGVRMVELRSAVVDRLQVAKRHELRYDAGYERKRVRKDAFQPIAAKQSVPKRDPAPGTTTARHS